MNLFFNFIVSNFDTLTWHFNWFNCHHQLEPDLCSEFSLDLRAHCSAILVSQLLRIFVIMDFLKTFTSVHEIEIEDVLLDLDWNELFSSVPTHRSFEMHPHVMANVALHWNHETIIGSQMEILSSFACDFACTARHQ